MARPKSRGELKPLNVNIDADISNELTKKQMKQEYQKLLL